MQIEFIPAAKCTIEEFADHQGLTMVITEIADNRRAAASVSGVAYKAEFKDAYVNTYSGSTLYGIGCSTEEAIRDFALKISGQLLRHQAKEANVLVPLLICK